MTVKLIRKAEEPGEQLVSQIDEDDLIVALVERYRKTEEPFFHILHDLNIDWRLWRLYTVCENPNSSGYYFRGQVPWAGQRFKLDENGDPLEEPADIPEGMVDSWKKFSQSRKKANDSIRYEDYDSYEEFADALMEDMSRRLSE